MIIESLIQEYLGIPNKFFDKSSQFDLSKNNRPAAEAKYWYLQNLYSYILDLIKEENNSTTLEYLIKKYEKSLYKEPDLIVHLYKKYLAFEQTNELYYKKFAELIIVYKGTSAGTKAHELYKFVQEHNWKAAADTLKLID